LLTCMNNQLMLPLERVNEKLKVSIELRPVH